MCHKISTDSVYVYRTYNSANVEAKVLQENLVDRLRLKIVVRFYMEHMH